MKWFIIVVMTAQLSAGGKDETPLWIPELAFDSQEECMTFARNNQIRLFRKSIESYQGTLLPTGMKCIDQNLMNELGEIYRENQNEELI